MKAKTFKLESKKQRLKSRSSSQSMLHQKDGLTNDSVSSSKKFEPKSIVKKFQLRKQQHISISLDSESQYRGNHPLDQIHLKSLSFPELNWSELEVSTQILGKELSAPFFISSMTAGHKKSLEMNSLLAELSQEKQIFMGLGSQRRELFDKNAKKEWQKIRKKFPRALFLSNIGLSQLIHTPIEIIQELVDNVQSEGIFIHTNPLQECLQKEGTPEFKGGLKAIEALCRHLKVPVIVKEVGCGFSLEDMTRLDQTGIYALDLSAKGGTDWARVESLRWEKESWQRDSGFIFSGWGYTFPQMHSLIKDKKLSYKLWMSGGIRNGLDIAKVLAMKCEMVGLAQPWLKALTSGNLFNFYESLVKELKTSMFCVGVKSVKEFQTKKVCHDVNEFR